MGEVNGMTVKTIKIDVDPEVQALIWGVRSQSILGQRAYNKILDVADSDLAGLKDIKNFIGVLVQIKEEQEKSN